MGVVTISGLDTYLLPATSQRFAAAKIDVAPRRL
jgi:hypothetical protein